MSLFHSYVNGLQIIHFQNSILGLTTHKVLSRSLKTSQLQIMRNVAAILIFTIYSAISLYNLYFYLQIKKSLIFNITELLTLATTSLYTIILWLFAITKTEKIQHLLYKMIDMDKSLQKMGATFNYQKQNRRDLTQMVVRFALVTVSGFNLMVVRWYDGDDVINTELARILLNLHRSAACHYTIRLVSTIEQRFDILNTIFTESLRNNITRTDKFSLDKITQLHYQLCEVVHHFNQIFGIQLLFFFWINFISAPICCFWLFYQLRAKVIKWFFVQALVCYFVLFWADILYLCAVCCRTINKANLFRKLMVSSRGENQQVLDKTKMFLLEAAVKRKVEFTVANFFAIDQTLITSIIAGVSTYCLILVQTYMQKRRS